MRMKKDDWYITSANTLLRFTEVPADIDTVFPNTIQGTRESISRAIFDACYKDDPCYTRNRLKETVLPHLVTDISTDDDGTRTAQFRNSNGELLEGFALGRHDDVSNDSLLRLFGDGLIKKILEKEKLQVPAESLVPSSIVKDGDIYIGTYISPAYLTRHMELTDEGKELFGSKEKYLREFESFVKHPYLFGYEEYDSDKKIAEKSGLLGPDVPADKVPELGRYLGSFSSLEEAIHASTLGATLEMELSRIQEKADTQGQKKEQEKELQRGG